MVRSASRLAAAGAALLLALTLPGCSLIQTPGPKEVAGPTDGYLATSPFLKVYVRSNSSGDMVLVNFDRRDWWVSKIADAVDDKDVAFLTVTATPRAIMGEYLVEHVDAPADLEQYRYSTMGATAEDRQWMDAEYDALIARLLEERPERVVDDAENGAPQPQLPPLRP